MLLTLSQPPDTEFGHRPPHEFSQRLPVPKSRLSPPTKVEAPPSSLRVSVTAGTMSTPHRGLPPPSAMALPEPNRPPPPPLSQSLGPMPTPPGQWAGQEESMRNWLVAKAEEDKRKQEEEKTRQESYRLEQRRIEQAMLRESLQAGVPPSMVPMIYAGIGGANLANVSLDWLQQYAAQLQATQQQLQQQTSPELRRETRLIGQAPTVYQQPPAVAGQPAQMIQPGAPIQSTFQAYDASAAARGPQSAVPRSAHTQLPRLTTNEMFIHQPSQSAGNPGSAHPLQQTQTISQDPPTSSPSIYFHHWVPPSESKAQPQTPASRGEPHSAHPGSLASEGEFKDSPRKRKAQGAHQPAPIPSTSPSFGSSAAAASSSRRGGHGRTRSNASIREPESRPTSRRDTEVSQSASQPESTEERRPPDTSRQREEPSRPPSQEARQDIQRPQQ